MTQHSGIKKLGLATVLAVSAACAGRVNHLSHGYSDLSRGSCSTTNDRTFCSYNYDSGAVALLLRNGKLYSEQIVDYLGSTVLTVDIVPDKRSEDIAMRSTPSTKKIETRLDYDNFWADSVMPIIFETQRAVNGMTIKQFAAYRNSHEPKSFFLVAIEGSGAAAYIQYEATNKMGIIKQDNLAGSDKK